MKALPRSNRAKGLINASPRGSGQCPSMTKTFLGGLQFCWLEKLRDRGTRELAFVIGGAWGSTLRS